jgi:hypothetical protein
MKRKELISISLFPFTLAQSLFFLWEPEWKKRNKKCGSLAAKFLLHSVWTRGQRSPFLSTHSGPFPVFFSVHILGHKDIIKGMAQKMTEKR